jgi:hypothetical protein
MFSNVARESGHLLQYKNADKFSNYSEAKKLSHWQVQVSVAGNTRDIVFLQGK